MKKTYITISAEHLISDLFRKPLRPLDNYRFKPSGGLWASEFGGESEYISEWYDYLFNREDLSFYKDTKHACRFTLKEDAKILEILNFEEFLKLTQKYPSLHHIISYYGKQDIMHQAVDFEEISKDYDGVFVNPYFLSNKTFVFLEWSVNTLLLFNLECIDKYESLIIKWTLDPYLYPPRMNLDCYPYISKKTGPYQIEKNSEPYLELYSLMKKLFIKLLIKKNNVDITDYDNYLRLLISTAKQVCDIVIKYNYSACNQIILEHQTNETTIDKEFLIVNIALNILSEFLEKDRDRMKTFPKLKSKSPISYHSIYKI